MRPDKYILDLNGEPVAVNDVDIWAEWFERASRDGSRILKQDFVEGEDGAAHFSLKDRVGVSTVFLGLDHQWGDGPPILWESLVSGTSLDGQMQRYTSRADALRGHDALLEEVRAAYDHERPP